MNRGDLDAFFAKAEDVLTDWRGSCDSMNTGKDSAEERLLGAILRPSAPTPDGVVIYAVSEPLFGDDHAMLARHHSRLCAEYLFVDTPRPLLVISAI